MFISRKEAADRLGDRRNKLRDREMNPEIPETVDLPAAPDDGDGGRKQAPTKNGGGYAVAIPEQGEEGEAELGTIADQEARNIQRAAEHLHARNLPPLTLAALDDLVAPGPKVSYRGKLNEQAAIAELGLSLPSNQMAGALVGLGQGQTGAYTRALSSSADPTNHIPPKPALKARVDAIREVLAAKAATRLGETLDILDSDKLRKVKRATNLARIAKDMASIVEKVSPKESTDPGGVHFHIYRPEMNVAQNYAVVTVGSADADDESRYKER